MTVREQLESPQLTTLIISGALSCFASSAAHGRRPQEASAGETLLGKVYPPGKSVGMLREPSGYSV